MDESYLDHLNERQREAVAYGLSRAGHLPPPLLVIAGAGTGKTATLAHRVAHTVVCGGDPTRIMLLTFSRRAATEMASRTTKLVGKALRLNQTVELPWCGTFHSVGARLLREYASNIGIGADFNIHDRSDSADLIDLVRHELDLSVSKSRFPRKETCLSIYSMVINTQGTLEEVLSTAFPWCEQWLEELRRLFAGYVKAKQNQHILDFDDLLLYWSHMMKIPAIANDVADRFDYVFVDEYQDTNRMQQDILLAMKPSGEGVTVVGDDAQAIYRFRAAEIQNILGFPDAFKPKAKVITLEQNYRSSQPILTAANAVITLAKDQYSKNLWTARKGGEKPKIVAIQDEAVQAQYVADTVLANREVGSHLRDQAILFRASHHSALLEVELTRRDIPFVKFGGLRFMDAAHIKDVVCVIRWAQNLRDKVSGFRILKLLPGFGSVKARRLVDALAVSAASWEEFRKYSPPTAAKPIWADFMLLMERLRAPMLGWPADLPLVREWYSPILEAQYDDHKERLADIIQLEQIAHTFPTREKFVSELTLDPTETSSRQAANANLDDDYLILSTVHSVKGLEYSHVFVLSCIDGHFPSDLAVGEKEAIEEERRLLYVAMTRAKNSLTLLLPQNFYVHKQPAMGNRHVLAGRTRFIPDSILSHFELSAWPTSARTNALIPQIPTFDIKSSVSAMWDKASGS